VSTVNTATKPNSAATISTRSGALLEPVSRLVGWEGAALAYGPGLGTLSRSRGPLGRIGGPRASSATLT
jgi:hypothetical protein